MSREARALRAKINRLEPKLPERPPAWIANMDLDSLSDQQLTQVMEMPQWLTDDQLDVLIAWLKAQLKLATGEGAAQEPAEGDGGGSGPGA